jgi:hypothetical protein
LRVLLPGRLVPLIMTIMGIYLRGGGRLVQHFEVFETRRDASRHRS